MKNAIGTTLLTVLFLSLAAFRSQPVDRTFELTFIDHLTAGLIEQDVFVEKIPNSGLVYRVQPEDKEQYLDAPLYTTATMQRHDPFDMKQVGPYMKGKSLGITLRDWLGASGKASCSCEGGWGKFEASMDNLVPNSMYTIWHFFMPAPPTEPFTGALELPLGDRDGSESVFTTDENGHADINLRFERCLQLGENQLMSGVAMAYHSDKKTYGSYPGPFGSVTHVQTFALLPNVKDLVTN
jgi:hypothetical protein